MKIKEMMQEQRPREKALRLGIESLSDTELLCLIISSGTKNRPVDVIAEDLLKNQQPIHIAQYSDPVAHGDRRDPRSQSAPDRRLHRTMQASDES